MAKSAIIAVLQALLLFAATGAAATEDACPGLFANNAAPVLLNDKMKEKTVPLCFSEFGLLHSGVTRTPLWSGDHLTAENLEAGLNLPRHNSFHEEERIDPEDRATINDYRRSGYDRGHMSPNGDMSTAEAKEETFTLANMVPQAPCNNEVLWEGIERAVRKMVTEDVDEVYVVTGPAFNGQNLESLKGRVLVPTHIWKAVYIPSKNVAAAYWSVNDNNMDWGKVTIADLQVKTGIDVFPGLDEKIKKDANAVNALPQPEAPKYRCRVQR